MKGRIALITILTDDVPKLSRFYQDVLGFTTDSDLGLYVELASKGVRFAICSRAVMEDATGHPSFNAPRSGQAFELAFPLNSPRKSTRRIWKLLTEALNQLNLQQICPGGSAQRSLPILMAISTSSLQNCPNRTTSRSRMEDRIG